MIKMVVDFYRLLEEIYGKSYVAKYIILSKRGLQLNMERIQRDAIDNKKHIPISILTEKPCNNCEIKQKKKMDFPGWQGDLEFMDDQKPAKRIMLIGYDPNPPVTKQRGEFSPETQGIIQIAYEFGYRTKDNGYANEDMAAYFNYFGLLGQVDQLYLTDRCKCFAGKNKAKKVKCYNQCKEFLRREIKLIRPQFIIFHGKESLGDLDNFIEGLQPRPEKFQTDHCSYLFPYTRFYDANKTRKEIENRI